MFDLPVRSRPEQGIIKIMSTSPIWKEWEHVILERTLEQANLNEMVSVDKRKVAIHVRYNATISISQICFSWNVCLFQCTFYLMTSSIINRKSVVSPASRRNAQLKADKARSLPVTFHYVCCAGGHWNLVYGMGGGGGGVRTSIQELWSSAQGEIKKKNNANYDWCSLIICWLCVKMP